MNKQIYAGLLVISTVMALFVVAFPFIPTYNNQFFAQELYYSSMGVLGANQTIGNYPTNLLVNQSFLVYLYVNNHEGVVQYYQVEMKLGSNNTVVTNTTSANEPVLATYLHYLDNNNTWYFPTSISISQPLTRAKLIFELWKFEPASGNFVYSGVFLTLLINVRSRS